MILKNNVSFCLQEISVIAKTAPIKDSLNADYQKKSDIYFRIYTSSWLERVAAASGLAEEFRIALTQKNKNKE